MRKPLFLISLVIVSICLAASGLLYWYLLPPYGTFPITIAGAVRDGKVQYKKDDTSNGVYGAVYGMGGSNFYMAGAMDSADTAKERVRTTRESIRKEADTAFTRWKNDDENKFYDDDASAEIAYREESNAIYIAREDSPANDYLVYVSNGRAQVIWARGSWLYSTMVPADSEQYPSPEFSAAHWAFDFARSAPYPPLNTTVPPPGEFDRQFGLYDLLQGHLPLWFSEMFPVLVPLIIGLPFLLVMLFQLRKGTPSGAGRSA